MAKVTIIITPTSGDPTTIEDVEGKTIHKALEAAGRSWAGMNIFLNDEPSKRGVELKDGDVIKLNERPKGS